MVEIELDEEIDGVAGTYTVNPMGVVGNWEQWSQFKCLK
jgi:hypothetical protein